MPQRTRCKHRAGCHHALVKLPRMHPHIASRRALLEALCRQNNVARLEVFGSAAGEDFDPSRSDVDLLVEFSDAASPDPLGQYFGFKAQLESALERPVDLLMGGAIKNPYLKLAIDRSRELVYAA